MERYSMRFDIFFLRDFNELILFNVKFFKFNVVFCIEKYKIC